MEHAFNLLCYRDPPVRIHWVNANIAIGSVSQPEDWAIVHDAGVRAVVDLCRESEDLGDSVRHHGMRYLRLALRDAAVPSAEDMQIVTSWVLDRAADGGRVLIQDGYSRFNDGLVAVASLIKSGLPAHLALVALRRVIPGDSLDSEQNTQLVKFTTTQVAGGC